MTEQKSQSNSTSYTTDVIVNEIADLRKQIELLTQKLEKNETVKGTAKKADQEAKQAKEKVSHNLSDAELQADMIKEKVESTIKEQPTTAISIAAGLGFIVGMMLRR